MNTLKDRFVSLWHRHAHVDSEDIANGVFDQLANMYTESWRSFHNIEHIAASLGYFDACKSQAQFADAIEFAIWFHDCVYILGARDNEARSRDWFIQQSENYLVPAVCTHVDSLIMDTCHHEVPSTDDGKLIADIDLTSFGLPWEEYMQDSQAVQGEYPEENTGKAKENKICFLKNLISDGQVYYSNYYLTHFEHKAQQNVKKHLQILQQH